MGRSVEAGKFFKSGSLSIKLNQINVAFRPTNSQYFDSQNTKSEAGTIVFFEASKVSVSMSKTLGVRVRTSRLWI